MISPMRLLLGVGVMALAGFCVPVSAQDRDAGVAADDSAPIVKHRINRRGADSADAQKGFALTTGSTSNLSPLTSHGGPVINTPVIYYIWYGNWNQANGSDNAAGQQILRDFATSIAARTLRATPRSAARRPTPTRRVRA